MSSKETRKNIIQAGQKAVEELIKVAKEPIVDSDDDISADRLKNAAATKKLAIFDAFEILNRIQEEENLLEGKTPEEKKERVFKGFAEGRSTLFKTGIISKSFSNAKYRLEIVCAWMLWAASTTNKAPSQAAIERETSYEKSTWPGVSIKFKI